LDLDLNLDLKQDSYMQCLKNILACSEDDGVTLNQLSEEKYINSEFINKWNLSFLKPLQPKPHGPAAQVDLKTDLFPRMMDITPYIKFEGWPITALEWIKRVRLNNWPSMSLVSDVVECGFGVVPVSYQNNSIMADYEWRLSFSKAENLLFHNMNSQQLLIFAMFKNLIDTSSIDTELLKTYYIKNMFFWFLEKVPLVHIYKENIGVLLISFINDMLLSLSERRIPHYFVPSVNLIESMTIYASRKLYHEINNFRKNLIKPLETTSCDYASYFISPSTSYNDMFEVQLFKDIIDKWSTQIWQYFITLYPRFDKNNNKTNEKFYLRHLCCYYQGILMIENYFRYLKENNTLGQSLRIPLFQLIFHLCHEYPDELFSFRCFKDHYRKFILKFPNNCVEFSTQDPKALNFEWVTQCLLVLISIGYLYSKKLYMQTEDETFNNGDTYLQHDILSEAEKI
jgi:hypothetical protein